MANWQINCQHMGDKTYQQQFRSFDAFSEGYLSKSVADSANHKTDFTI